MEKLLSALVLGAAALTLSSSAFAYGSTHHHYMMRYAHATHYKTVVDAALASKNLSTLVTTLKAGGLVSTLQVPGPFIVFAPTNQAFSQLPPNTLSSLLKPENKAKLQSILKYHVVACKTLTAKTLQRSDVTLKTGVKMVSGAHVLGKVKTSNGTVYIINKVLLPKLVPY